MRRIVIVSALIVSVLGTGALVPSEAEAREPVVIDCRTLVGTGRGTRPLQIGTIRRLTVVANCPALSQGYGFNSRYFVFRLRRAATNESYVGAAWMPRPDAIAGVHPFLVTMQGVVIARSPTHGQSARATPMALTCATSRRTACDAAPMSSESSSSTLRCARCRRQPST